MTRVFRAVTATDWLITPSGLTLICAMAQRNVTAPEVEAAAGWLKRDYEHMAGPGAKKLDGAHRAYVNGGVAVIPMMGPIFPRANMMTEMSGATSVASLQNDLQAAMASLDVGAIMLLIDSPGGAVSGIDSFANQVAAAAKRKPITSHVLGTAASAAYWIGAMANEMTLERTAIVGSIGVVAAYPKQVEPDRDGYIDVEIVSSNAPNKRPDVMTEDGLDEVRGRLNALEAIFISDVAKGRKTTVAKVREEFRKGGTEVGEAAVALGMADRVQSQETTLKSMQRAVVANQRLEAQRQKGQ